MNRFHHGRRLALIAVALLVQTPQGSGDAIVWSQAMKATTIAEIHVEEAGVRVDLEIGLRDLPAFHNILPDEVRERMGFDPEPLSERIPRFFTEDWIIRCNGSDPLPGYVKEMNPRARIRRDEITGDPLPVQGEEDELVVYAELVLPFSGRPSSLSIRPPIQEDSRFAAADIGFMAYHEGLPVNDFRYLSAEETLDLDWSDPWFSRFRNRNLLRRYNSPIAGFLYVEPFEIRKEIIVRPMDLQHWIDLGLEGKDVIPLSEQEGLKNKVVEFLMGRCPVTVDGEPVEFVLDRINFIERSLRLTGVVDPPRDLPVVSATLGVIFVRPIDALPREAEMRWDLFKPKVEQLFLTACDEAGGLPWQVTPDDPILKWQNFLKNPTIPAFVDLQPPPGAPELAVPVVSALCGLLLLVLIGRHFKTLRAGRMPPRGAVVLAIVLLGGLAVAAPFAHAAIPIPLLGPSGISDEDAGEVVKGLLRNIYRAFDYRDEEMIYDTLARSSAGDLLTRIYLETRRGLELENQGGARVKVKEVEMLVAEIEQSGGEGEFAARCTWNVSGSVGHWGHIHTRINQYEAEITVEPVDGQWKITDMELLEENRIDTQGGQ